MCGRYAQYQTSREHLAHVREIVGRLPRLRAEFNITKSQLAGVVRVVDGTPAYGALEWQFYESWFPNVQRGPQINARHDTVATNGLFRNAFRKRRCLVLASAWYEWMERAKKWGDQPFAFRFRDERVFAIAGIWTTGSYKRPGAGSFAMITTRAAQTGKHVHRRMPVILQRKDWDMWLDPEYQAVTPLKKLLRPYEGKELKVFPVDGYVNNSRHQGKGCLEPLSRAEIRRLQLVA